MPVSLIKSRLRRLEESKHAGRCPECGLAPHERRPPAVINEEHPEKSFDGDPYERCARCGRPLYTVLRVVYEGEGGVANA
jgi:ribosomal protein S14